MQELKLFAIELLISFGISAIVLLFLNKPLYRLLIDLCGTEARAKFWLIYSNVMLVIAPLLFVIIFGKSNSDKIELFSFYKTAFGSSLAGVFISLAVIGTQITKSLPKGTNINENT